VRQIAAPGLTRTRTVPAPISRGRSDGGSGPARRWMEDLRPAETLGDRDVGSIRTAVRRGRRAAGEPAGPLAAARSPRSVSPERDPGSPSGHPRPSSSRDGLQREATAAAPRASGRYEGRGTNEAVDHRRPRRPGGSRSETGRVGAGRDCLIVDDPSRLLADGRFFGPRRTARACQDLLAGQSPARASRRFVCGTTGAHFPTHGLRGRRGAGHDGLVTPGHTHPEGRGSRRGEPLHTRGFLAEPPPQGHRVTDSSRRLPLGDHVANQRVHAESGQKMRLESSKHGGPHRQASPDLLREALRWL